MPLAIGRARRTLASLALVGAVATGCGGLGVPTPTPAQTVGLPTRAAAVASQPAGAPTAASGLAAPTPAAAATANVVTIGGAAPAAFTAGPAAQASTPVAAAASVPSAAAAPAPAPAVAPPPAAASDAAPPVATLLPGSQQADAATATAASVVAVGGTPVPTAAGAQAAAAAAPSPIGATAGTPATGGSTTAVIGAVTPGAAPLTTNTGNSGTNRARSPFFGLYPFSTNFDTTADERHILADAGAGLAQVAVDWSQIEFDEGYSDAYGPQNTFDSTAIGPVDSRIRALADAGFQPVLLVVNPPKWALVNADTQGPIRTDKLPKYVTFVRRLVARYSVAPYNARYVVLAPEPDHRGSIPSECAGKVMPLHRGWGDNAGQFVTLLQQTYPAVKAANPSVSVIMGALAYDNFGGTNKPAFNSGPCGPFNYTFLDEVLAQGGANYFDTFAFNAYAFYGIGWEQQQQAGGAYDVAAKANVLRTKFPQLGGKDWIVLESGVWSDPSTWVTVRMPDGTTRDVTPNDDWQAAYPGKLFARGLSVGLKAIVWYGTRDQPDDQQRGLLDQGGRPKKAYTAFRQATAALAGATSQGVLQPRATASGKAEGYVFRSAAGGRVVALWAVGDLSSRARVTVDMPGGNVRALDLYGGAVQGLQVQGDQVTLEVGGTPVYLMSGT